MTADGPAARGESDTGLAGHRRAAWLKPEPREIAGAQFDAWRVFTDHAGRYFAESEEFPKLRVALEVFDAEAPRLVDWEIRIGPFKGIGVLVYRAGRLAGETQTDEVDFGTVVDLAQQSVIGLEPYRQGKRPAVWTWDKGAQSVNASDGITSEYQLRAVKDDRFNLSLRGGATARSTACSAGASPASRRSRSRCRRSGRRSRSSICRSIEGGARGREMAGFDDADEVC